MKLDHRIRFFQQLAALSRAGVPLVSSLQRLEKRLSDREINLLAKKLAEGERIEDAFTAAGFTPFECHLVGAGERSAQLDLVYERLAEFWRRELTLSQALRRQLYYPIVVLHLTVLVSALTHIMDGIPAMVWAIVTGLAVLYATLLVGYLLIRTSWRSSAARRFWLFLPLIGRSLSTGYAYRWITALRLEFVAGVPFPDAVADAWLASGYIGAETHAQEGEQGLRAGEDLSQLVERWRQLPREWIDFVETGEASGEFEAMFTNMEAEASRDWTRAQDRMTEWMPKILSFVLLVIVGIIVGRLYYNVAIAPTQEALKAIDGL